MAAPRSRVERDLLGELEIPAAALYGVHTARAIRSLSVSGRRLGDWPAYVRSLAAVKQAAARANRDARVLTASLASAIEDACLALRAGEHRDQFPVDLLAGGGSIAANMNLNEVIANLANEALGGRRGAYEPIHPKTHVNASQSTADVCHTAVRLTVLTLWTDLQRALSDCGAALRAKAAELRPITTMSRTCLQDGFAVSLGELFGGFAAAAERRDAELDRAIHTLRHVNLGGTVIGSGTGAPDEYRAVVLEHLSEIAGTELARRANLYDAAQNIDDLAAASAQLALLANVLIKISQDLRLLASGPTGGFGEIRLPAVQDGSSFFTGKINPVVPETVLQCSVQVLACDRAVQLACERGELYLNVFEGLAALNLFDALTVLAKAIRLLVTCVSGLHANGERCAELAARARDSS